MTESSKPERATFLKTLPVVEDIKVDLDESSKPMSKPEAVTAEQFDKFWADFWKSPGERIMSDHHYTGYYAEHSPAHIERLCKAWADYVTASRDAELRELQQKIERLELTNKLQMDRVIADCTRADEADAELRHLRQECLKVRSDHGRFNEDAAIALGRPGLSGVFDDEVLRGIRELRAEVTVVKHENGILRDDVRHLRERAERAEHFQGDKLNEWIERYGKRGVELVNDGWQLAHDPASCGHPHACWLDRNYPESERNYNPETRTSDPPMDYRCIMCEAERERDALREQRDELSKALFAPHYTTPDSSGVCRACGRYAPSRAQFASGTLDWHYENCEARRALARLGKETT